MTIITRGRYTKQPQTFVRAGKGHWLAEKLNHIFVPGIVGGVDLLGNAQPIPFGTGSAAPGFGSIQQGKVLTEDGGDTSEHTGKACEGSSAYPFVMVACGYFSSSADAWQLAQMKRSGTGGGDTCLMGLASSTTVQYVLRHNFGLTLTLTLTTGAGSNSGLLMTMVAQSLSAADHRFYTNGQMTTGTTNVGAIPSAFDKLSIGGSKLNGGELYVGYGFKQAFTDEEALAFSNDPSLFWRVFPRARTLWVDTAAVAGNVFNPLSGRGGAAAQPLRTWQ